MQITSRLRWAVARIASWINKDVAVSVPGSRIGDGGATRVRIGPQSASDSYYDCYVPSSFPSSPESKSRTKHGPILFHVDRRALPRPHLGY